MRAREILPEKWSEKYKRSINCSNPKGFSQKAHCAGRKKNESVIKEFRAPRHDGDDDDYVYLQKLAQRIAAVLPQDTVSARIEDYYDLEDYLDFHPNLLRELDALDNETQGAVVNLVANIFYEKNGSGDEDMDESGDVEDYSKENNWGLTPDDADHLLNQMDDAEYNMTSEFDNYPGFEDMWNYYTQHAWGEHFYDTIRSELEDIRDGYLEIDRDVDEGWKSKLAGAALAGAAALGGGSAQAGDLEKSVGPLPIMATIKIKLPDGQIKTIRKDLGHAYDYKLDDAKKDLENILDKKGIKQYTIHLDRYNSNDAHSDKDYSAKSNYIDTSPYQAKNSKTDYMDKTPYKAKPTTVNYLDKSKSEKEFRDMDNY